MDMESNVCQNGCHKYIKTMYDVIKALAKHQNAALHLKEVNENLKKKLSKYRDHTTSMQHQIDKLELDLELEKEHTSKLAAEKK